MSEAPPTDARLRRLRVRGAEVHLLATVHGLFSEAEHVEEAFRAVLPEAVGIGVAPAELEALEAHVRGESAAKDEDDEDDEDGELSLGSDDAYASGLARFGEIGLPPPDLLTAVGLARTLGLAPAALDLDGAAYDEVFTRSVGPIALFRYGRRMKRMARRPPNAQTAAEFAVLWDARIRDLKGFAAVELRREEHMAERIAALAEGRSRVLAVVDVARAEGVARALARGR